MNQMMYTVPEVAALLRVGRSKVYELLEAGSLRSVKIGGSRRVSAGALESFVQSLDA